VFKTALVRLLRQILGAFCGISVEKAYFVDFKGKICNWSEE